MLRGCLEAPYHFLKAVTAPMVEAGEGRCCCSRAPPGRRPTPGAPLYSSARAAANMLVRNVAGEIARPGVQVNAVGTNFMDFPEFRRANGADDPEVRAKIESRVPMRRLGTVEECAAFCAAFLDGSSRFTTGQFVGYAGGWVWSHRSAPLRARRHSVPSEKTPSVSTSSGSSASKCATSAAASRGPGVGSSTGKGPSPLLVARHEPQVVPPPLRPLSRQCRHRRLRVGSSSHRQLHPGRDARHHQLG